MSDKKLQLESIQLEPAKILYCMLPDDGTDIALMHQLKNEKDITRVQSVACRGVNKLQEAKTRSGKLPEPALYRMLSIIVSEAQADDIFNFIYHTVKIGQQGHGLLIQATLLSTTAYSMPEDVADEKS